MNIIKNYSNWLVENLGSIPVNSKIDSFKPDLILGSTPLNKWSVSKAKPGFIIFPEFELNNNKTSWNIMVTAYSFAKVKNREGIESMINAEMFHELLPIRLPKNHPSGVNHSTHRVPDGPNDTSTEPNTVSLAGNPVPTESTMDEIIKKYPLALNGTNYSISDSISPEYGIKDRNIEYMDAYEAFSWIKSLQRDLTPDNFLTFLESVLPGAKALMVAHIKGKTTIAHGITYDKSINELIELVKKLPEYNIPIQATSTT